MSLAAPVWPETCIFTDGDVSRKEVTNQVSSQPQSVGRLVVAVVVIV